MPLKNASPVFAFLLVGQSVLNYATFELFEVYA